MNTRPLSAALAAAALFLFPAFSFGSDSDTATARPNTLSAAEKAAGWQLLFDGKSLKGWRAFLGTGIPEGVWVVEDGAIHALMGTHAANERKKDIITERTYTDYEFAWEWKLAPRANNGVKYLVTESRPTMPGPEYQMVDDHGRPARTDAQRLHATASFYEILPPAIDTPLRPAGEWNQSRIVVRGTRVEHWLNGRNVLTYDLTSPEVKAGIAKSKFKDAPGFGEKIAGHLMLTYHGDEAWFRNLKVREIK